MLHNRKTTPTILRTFKNSQAQSQKPCDVESEEETCFLFFKTTPDLFLFFSMNLLSRSGKLHLKDCPEMAKSLNLFILFREGVV